MTVTSKRLLQLLALFVVLSGSRAYADAVTQWNAYLEQAVYATAEPIPSQPRSAAILHAAMFDAINGIARKYEPFFVKQWAQPGSRQEAAAVQAAYEVLITLYPSQKAVLDAHLADALMNIPGHEGNSLSIARGREWGSYVAQQILSWRSTDGFTTPVPPYFGGPAPGVWRSPPTPTAADGTLPAVFTQIAVMKPFVLKTQSQFRPGPPPALTSAQYAADVNEVKAIGRFDSAIRTLDQTQLALLWQAVGAINENNIARSVVPADNELVDNARLFALINIAAADGLIASFDSKLTYGLWRPYHAIRLADSDGNPDTVADPAWNSLFLAPRFPEYLSNHAVLTGAVMHVLSRLLGDDHTFTLSSPLFPTFTWTFDRFSDAAKQVGEARIWGGIHFRTACELGGQTGIQIADYILTNAMQPRRNHGLGN